MIYSKAEKINNMFLGTFSENSSIKVTNLSNFDKYLTFSMSNNQSTNKMAANDGQIKGTHTVSKNIEIRPGTKG